MIDIGNYRLKKLAFDRCHSIDLFNLRRKVSSVDILDNRNLFNILLRKLLND
jgi:hypothetical protein